MAFEGSVQACLRSMAEDQTDYPRRRGETITDARAPARSRVRPAPRRPP